MSFYFIFVFVAMALLLLGSMSRVAGRPFEVVVVLMLIFMAGLREYVGMDFYNYWEMYTAGIADENIEPGFLLLMQLLRTFNTDYHVFFFIFAVLIYLFVYKGITAFTEHSGIALMVYILIPGLFLNSLSVIRQALAIAISFYSFSLLLKEKKPQYFLFILLGLSFHYTCLLTVPFHFLAKKYAQRLSLRFYIIAIVATFIFGQLSVSQLVFAVLKNFDRYSLYSNANPMNFTKLLVLNAFTGALLLFKNRLSERPENDYFFFLTVVSLLVTNVASSFEYATRFSYFFKMFEVVVIAEIAYVFGRNLRMLAMPVIFSYYLFVFYTALAGDDALNELQFDGSKLVPYNSVFTREPLS